MTQDDCKLITEWLGEVYHQTHTVFIPGIGETYQCSCFDKINHSPGFHHNRTFTDPQDFFACFEKLVERGEWDGFFHFTYLRFEKSNPLKNNPPRFAQWCNSRTESGHYRLCQLTAEYLKEKEKNNG
jgi:hypothetical protein